MPYEPEGDAGGRPFPGSFQTVQKVHKKLPQIGCILRVQSGRRENLLTKWIYFLLKKGPPNPRRRHGPNKPPAAPTSYCSPAHARQSPGGGQTTDTLHSGGVSDTDSAGSSPFSRRCLFLRVEAGTLQREPVSAPARRCPGCLLMAGSREFFCMERRNCPSVVDNCAPVWYHNGRKTNMAREVFRKTAYACRRSKTLRRPHRAGTKDGCGSGEAHCEDRRCKAATPNLSGKRTE